MSFTKLLFSRKFRSLRDSLRRVDDGTMKIESNRLRSDSFISNLILFSSEFYWKGFILSVTPTGKPIFGDAYKNIPDSVFQKTFIAVPIFYALKYGRKKEYFQSSDSIEITLAQIYPTLDLGTLKILVTQWKNVDPFSLDDLLFEYFDQMSVFKGVFEPGSDIRKWFRNYLDQIYTMIARTEL